ncbi:MAG: GNAT family N-acetyltransferase [Acetatifactor sp.]|nr:GNAT family N-acetyltransferase [Acetatifactor sp.]
MTSYCILKIQDHGELTEQAAEWFHSKWQIPKEAYLESINMCLEKKMAVPQWYAVMDGERMIAGCGVIENDFHDRKDLSPNVCAVYVEEDCRNQGIAGKMLRFVCEDMENRGVSTLYLLTDHTHFYERYGWELFCMVQGDGEEHLSRMYRFIKS